MSILVAPQVGVKADSETRTISISFAGVLGDSETITGTPVVASNPGGITAAAIAVNTVALVINDVTVAIGQAVQFTAAGGDAGTFYLLKITVVSSSGQTVERWVTLNVLTDPAP